jgi:hypothetical protein
VTTILLSAAPTARHGLGRRVGQVSQNNPSSIDTARGLGPRPKNLQQRLPCPASVGKAITRRGASIVSPIQPPPLHAASRNTMRNQTQGIDLWHLYLGMGCRRLLHLRGKIG